MSALEHLNRTQVNAGVVNTTSSSFAFENRKGKKEKQLTLLQLTPPRERHRNYTVSCLNLLSVFTSFESAGNSNSNSFSDGNRKELIGNLRHVRKKRDLLF